MRHRKVLADEAKVPDKRLKNFLLGLVNADVEDHAGTIFHRYSEFLPHAPRSPQEAQQNSPLLMALMRRWKKFDPRRLPTKLETYQREIIAEMEDSLRAVWEAGDVEAAKWRLRGFESFMDEVMAVGTVSGPPAPDAPPLQGDAMAPSALPPSAPLSQALAYLGQNLPKLKKCSNRECDTPYFVAKRPDDECCSDVCANEMRGWSKKRYWEKKRKGLAVPERGAPKPVAKRIAAKSTGVRGEQQAIPDSALKEFVLDVVNGDKGKIDDGKLYFFSSYPEFFPTKEKDIEAVVSIAGHNPAMFGKMKQEWPAIYHRRLMRELHEGLRGVWQAEDESTAERLLFELQSFVHGQVNISGTAHRTIQPPSSHPIQQALQWVGEHLSKLRRCRNVKCPSPRPFFVADTKEEFCSDACSHEGNKERKRESWGRNKQKWRKKPGKG
jgi:hypothetical protein